MIVIKNDQSEFVVTMHFDFLFRMRPRALWQQTPPEPTLIPSSKNFPEEYKIIYLKVDW